MKRIDHSFYHPTCLFMFNLADVKSFELQLKTTAEKSIGKVTEGKKCLYCLPDKEFYGLRIGCSEPFCENVCHPICGYLRGCGFKIEREEELRVSMKCQYLFYYLVTIYI